MRPNQQNRRTRGRGNRKGPNPLTRSYESNGPDVKIRGSAQQIAEKYAALARDAQGSGDRVMAENYLQHAEHYNRIIAAAQGQLPVQAQREQREDYDDEDEQDAQAAPVADKHLPDGSGPQPVINGMPAEVALGEQAGAVNGSGDRGEQPVQKAPRRARRPRKEAAKPMETGSNGDGSENPADAKDTGPEDQGSRLAAAGG